MTESSPRHIIDMQRLLQSEADLSDADARCLPGVFYTDPDYFNFEVETFLSREWHCLGRADEIPNPGDYFTTRLLKEPLIVVRRMSGDIAVLSNVCRHRGMQVVSGAGSRKRFVCPYHAWSYDLEGQLVKAPMMELSQNALKGCRLPEFRTETWNGFIFVNLDDAAAPLAPRLGRLGNLLANYRTENMRIVASFDEQWQTNWKCLVENFSESYHLSVVHPKTLHPYTPTTQSRKSLSDESFTAYVANYAETSGLRGHGSPDLTEEERRRSTLFCLFPTHLVSQAATLLVSMSVQPTAVNLVQVRWTISTYENELSDAELDERIALWQEVNREDREKLEQLQYALGSRYAPSGPLAMADLEGTIRDFYLYLARKAM